jgi:hypothetical protein
MPSNKKANKGEWSELLVFTKIANDAHIDMSNAKLQTLVGQKLEISKILRDDIIFSISDANKIFRTTTDGNIVEILKTTLPKRIKEFTSEIISADGVFQSKWGNDLLDSFQLSKIKAASNKKSNIDLTLTDPKTLLETNAGFSIKSYMGGKSSLLNASKQNTNFQFRVKDFQGDFSKVNAIKSRNKVRDRIANIISNGGIFEFNKAKGDIFGRNLMKIDSLMPAILGNLTFVNFIITKKRKKILDVIQSDELMEFLKSLPIQLDSDLISYKVKSLLLDIALGMVPKKDWDGRQSADGGYIVVKKTGEVVCFHVYNFADFSDYLFLNTMFDTPSTGKHDFGFLYQENNEMYFDVNCNIKFI